MFPQSCCILFLVTMTYFIDAVLVQQIVKYYHLTIYRQTRNISNGEEQYKTRISAVAETAHDTDVEAHSLTGLRL